MSDTSGEHASGPTGSVVLIGPPGAGCTTVGRALAGVRGVPVADLGEEVARAAGTSPDVALVAVPEARAAWRTRRSGAPWTRWSMPAAALWL